MVCPRSHEVLEELSATQCQEHGNKCPLPVALSQVCKALGARRQGSSSITLGQRR